MDAQVFGIALALATGLGAVVWWVIVHTQVKVDRSEERTSERFDNERRSREEDRHTLRDEITSVSNKLGAHELHVAREYVNHDRLAQTLRPLEAGVARVETSLERIFEKLDDKQDKVKD